MAEKSELEQTHCLVSKVFAFTVPPLGSADGFKASLWPKQPIWIGRLRVVSRGGKCAILLEHTDKEGLFASCPIQNEKTVEPAVDSSRYFVLRLSDGKGRHALIGIGFNDRTQAFDFKVALQDWENQNREGEPNPLAAEGAPKNDYAIPQGGSIHVSFGAPAKKKSPADVSAALAGLKLDTAEEAERARKAEKKAKKEKKKREKEAAEAEPGASASGAAAAAPSSAAPAIIDFGFGDFDPLTSPKKPIASAAAPRRASVADPFAADAAPSFDATPFDTPFDDTPSDWVKF